ncbi:MAG: cytidine deaminase [Acidobacteria bacterium]|nr:MAG: cytidine deaminase [Acidobacteriota bacterium]
MSNVPLLELKKLIARAYAPYSDFKVAVIIRDRNGKVANGVNVENASYGLTSCAERNAVFSFVANGLEKPAELFLYTETEAFTAPCGACRQVLMEFDPNLPIVMINRDGEEKRVGIRELVPMPFGPEDLDDAK